jgi:GAF domain-containing protein
VLRLARTVTARHDVEDVLAETFRCLRSIVSFGGGSIQLLDDDGWIQLAAADPPAPPHAYAQAVPLATSVAGRVILTEQPVYLPDIDSYAGARARAGQTSTGVRSYLGVPLVADGRAIGLLQIDSPTVDAWSDEERTVLVSVAPIVAAAIQSARAYAQASATQVRARMLDRRLAAARIELDRLRVTLDAGGDVAAAVARLAAALDPDPTTLRLPQPRAVAAVPTA